ncbi:MAG: alpha-amylase family glycosyl hydrolase [Bacteroidota bacterium]
MKRVTWSLILLLMFSGCAEEKPVQEDTRPTTAFQDPPDWAKEAIWYQIFVERFHNGDPNNAPTIIDIKNCYPFVIPSNWWMNSTKETYGLSWIFPGTILVWIWALQDIRENGAESDYVDWYWVDTFDDPATAEDEFTYQGWFDLPSLPEIKETDRHQNHAVVQAYEGNLASETAKEHIFAVTRRWLDPNNDGDPSDGVDGFRLDVAGELPLGFWREFRQCVRQVNPDAYLLGEIWWKEWPDDLLDPAPFLEGDVFDAVMNYRWYRAARHYFNESPTPIAVSEFVDSLNSFRSNLRQQSNYALMNLTASHDVPRVGTSLFNKNKYKVHVKPNEDSSYKIHKPDQATYDILHLLLIQQFTYVGAPHIWAGDEMGMWGADDPSCRKPLIWPELQFEAEVFHPLGQERPQDQVVVPSESRSVQ